MSSSRTATAPAVPPARPPARRVRHQARDAVSVMAVSAGLSLAFAAVLLLLTSLLTHAASRA